MLPGVSALVCMCVGVRGFGWDFVYAMMCEMMIVCVEMSMS